MRAWAILGLLAIGTPASAEPITVKYTDSVSGYEWADFSATIGKGTDSMSAVCPVNGGFCAGVLRDFAGREFDVTGWIWASSDDVRDAFVNSTDLTREQVALPSNTELDATWGPQLVANFGFTRFYEGHWTNAYTRDGVEVVYDVVPPLYLGGSDLRVRSDVGFLQGRAHTEDSVYAAEWLYRPTPEPSTLALLVIGGAGLCRRGIGRTWRVTSWTTVPRAPW